MLDDAEAIQWGETDHDPYLSSYKKRRCWKEGIGKLSFQHPVTRENQLNLQHDTWKTASTQKIRSTKQIHAWILKSFRRAESLSKQLKVDTFPRMTTAKCHFEVRFCSTTLGPNKKKELSWFWHNLKFTWGSWGYYLLRQSFLRSGFETQLPNMESPRRMRLRKAEEELRSAMMAASKTWPLDTKKGLETVAPSASARSLVF